jgi:hypothetical protein
MNERHGLWHDESEDESEDAASEELTQATPVWCPYCGVEVEFIVDPSGGTVQEYVEDCEACCQPWSVRVTTDRDGQPTVEVATLDEG